MESKIENGAVAVRYQDKNGERVESVDRLIVAVGRRPNADGFVTETAAANFLIVRGGTVLSPPRGAILNGVSLQVVEELCRDLSVPFEERRLTVEDCRNADEAMLAGTSYCLAGVRRVAGADLSMRGPVRRRLFDEWSRRVGIDIERQILSNP